MKIQILGTGCPYCKALEANARAAASALGVAADFEKVTDIDAILNMGVMMTPALAVDGQVKSMGLILSKDQIVSILKGGK
jgi:small redox-active disulfide protein 2